MSVPPTHFHLITTWWGNSRNLTMVLPFHPVQDFQCLASDRRSSNSRLRYGEKRSKPKEWFSKLEQGTAVWGKLANKRETGSNPHKNPINFSSSNAATSNMKSMPGLLCVWKAKMHGEGRFTPFVLCFISGLPQRPLTATVGRSVHLKQRRSRAEFFSTLRNPNNHIHRNRPENLKFWKFLSTAKIKRVQLSTPT